MVQKAVATILAVIFASLAIADGALKCYICNTIMNPACKDPAAGNLEALECDNQNLQQFHSDVSSNHMLKNIASIFEVDTPKHLQPAVVPMYACAKIDMKVGQQDMTVRSCQLAKTENLDPCKVMKGKMNLPGYSMEYCDLCESDACNSSIMPTPHVLLFVLPIVGLFILKVFYQMS